MIRPIICLIGLVVSLPLHCGCVGIGSGKSDTNHATVGKSARLCMLEDIEGKSVHLGSLIQDRQRMRVREGRIEIEVDRVDYLVLIVTHAKCDLSPKLISELQFLHEEFRYARCRCAAVFFDKEDQSGPTDLKAFAGEGCTLLHDRRNICKDYYVRDKVPAITVIDNWGAVVFRCEGYLSPKKLLKKIKAGDFSLVETEPG